MKSWQIVLLISLLLLLIMYVIYAMRNKSSTKDNNDMTILIKVIQSKSGKETKENYIDTSETILAKNRLKNLIKISESILGRPPKICYKLDNITAVNKSIPGNVDANKINRMRNEIIDETFRAKSNKIYDLAAFVIEADEKNGFEVIEWDDKNVPVKIKLKGGNVSKFMEKVSQHPDPEIIELGNKYSNLKDKTDVLTLKEFGEYMYIMSVAMSKEPVRTEPPPVGWAGNPPCDNL